MYAKDRAANVEANDESVTVKNEVRISFDTSISLFFASFSTCTIS